MKVEELLLHAHDFNYKQKQRNISRRQIISIIKQENCIKQETVYSKK